LLYLLILLGLRFLSKAALRLFRVAANGKKSGAGPAFSRFGVEREAAEGRAAQKKSVR